MQESVVRMVVEVEGRRQVGRPRKTWRKCIEQDLNQLGLKEEMTQERREIMGKGRRKTKKKKKNNSTGQLKHIKYLCNVRSS